MNKLVFSAVLASAMTAAHGAPSSQSACHATFYSLYNGSAEMADRSQYAKAAALREASARIFQDCLHAGGATKDGLYPFDGVGAYLIAGTFWHLAGVAAEARRALALGETALEDVRQRYPFTTLTNTQRGYLKEMQRLIRDDESGRWAVWKN